MVIDRDMLQEIQRLRNRTLDFDQKLKFGQTDQAISATTDADVKGIDEAHVMLSAGVYNMVLRINGVPFKVAMTSAF